MDGAGSSAPDSRTLSLRLERISPLFVWTRRGRCRTTNPPTGALPCAIPPRMGVFVPASTYIAALAAGPAAYLAVKYNQLVVKALFLPAF
jgi:hypothetical protein